MRHIVEKITDMPASPGIVNLSEQSASFSSNPTQDVCGPVEYAQSYTPCR